MVLASLDPIFLSQENSKHPGICGSFLLGSGAILAWLGDTTGRWESRTYCMELSSLLKVGQRAMNGDKDILLKENTLVLNTRVITVPFHTSLGFKLPIWSTIANLNVGFHIIAKILSRSVHP